MGAYRGGFSAGPFSLQKNYFFYLIKYMWRTSWGTLYFHRVSVYDSMSLRYYYFYDLVDGEPRNVVVKILILPLFKKAMVKENHDPIKSLSRTRLGLLYVPDVNGYLQTNVLTHSIEDLAEAIRYMQ